MGIEGGGGFESFDRRRSPENRYRRGIEARGNHSPEAAAERENYWLADMGVTPETLERMREFPAHKGSSTEYLVYMLLLGKLVEQGAEWDPQRRTRVRNLVGVLRAYGFPNMTEQEQGSLIELSQATTFDMRSLEYEVTPDTVPDVQWIWGTFGLQVPQHTMIQEILEIPPAARPQPRHPRRIE